MELKLSRSQVAELERILSGLDANDRTRLSPGMLALRDTLVGELNRKAVLAATKHKVRGVATYEQALAIFDATPGLLVPEPTSVASMVASILVQRKWTAARLELLRKSATETGKKYRLINLLRFPLESCKHEGTRTTL